MADLAGTSTLPGEYAELYATLQERMKRGGDLSPGPTDTATRFRHARRWETERRAMHTKIVEAFKAGQAGRPRGGRAVLMTAGAPGAGKGSIQESRYEQRVILSVEVPHAVSVTQNAGRWHTGRIAFEQGGNAYGGRMSPEGMIDALYGKATTGQGHSISRENAVQLADRGLATGLITADRGNFTRTAPGPTAPAAATYQRERTTLGIAEAGRLRSPRAGAAPLTPSPRSAAPQAPDRTPPPAGRTR